MKTEPKFSLNFFEEEKINDLFDSIKSLMDILNESSKSDSILDSDILRFATSPMNLFDFIEH